MARLEIRVPLVVSLILIVFGLPAAGSFLYFGVVHLVGGSWADVLPALVLCALGSFLLLMAIAAFRGLRHRKRNSRGGHAG